MPVASYHSLLSLSLAMEQSLRISVDGIQGSRPLSEAKRWLELGHYIFDHTGQPLGLESWNPNTPLRLVPLHRAAHHGVPELPTITMADPSLLTGVTRGGQHGDVERLQQLGTRNQSFPASNSSTHGIRSRRHGHRRGVQTARATSTRRQGKSPHKYQPHARFC